MATTANGLPYPVGTDYVVNGDDAIKALAEALDARLLTMWTAYAPTFTDFNLGNGTVVARYKKVGRTVHYSGAVTLGSTSSGMNANGMQISLPFPAATGLPLGSGFALDASDAAKVFPAIATIYSNVNYLMLRAVNGLPVSLSNPFPWTSGDAFGWQTTYETSAAA